MNAAFFVYAQLQGTLTIQNLCQQKARLRGIQQEQLAIIYGAAFLVFTISTGRSLPRVTTMTRVGGLHCGLLEPTVHVSFASTSSATAAYLQSRLLFRNSIPLRYRTERQISTEHLRKNR